MKYLKYTLLLILLFFGCSEKFSNNLELDISPHNIIINKSDIYKNVNIKLLIKNNTNKMKLLFDLGLRDYVYPSIESEDELLQKFNGVNFIIYDSNGDMRQPGRFSEGSYPEFNILDSNITQLEDQLGHYSNGVMYFNNYALKLLPKQTITINANLRIDARYIYKGGSYTTYCYYIFKPGNYVQVDKKFQDGKYGEVFDGVIKSNKINISVVGNK